MRAMTPLSAEQLAGAFERISPRDASLLSRAVVDGEPREQCAERYGVLVESFDAMLFRAARELRGQLEPVSPAVLTTAEELWAAAKLAQALAQPEVASASSASLPAEAQLCLRLVALRVPLRTLLDAVEQDRTSGARARRETWLRRVLLTALILTAGFFYWRQQHRPKLEPRPRLAPARTRTARQQRLLPEAL